MIDVRHQINEVRRTVGTRVLEAGEARVITVSQTYQGDVDDVWDAVTNPERIRRWFLPVSGDLREGGRFELEGNASGTIERCEPPSFFAATWMYGADVSWIEVRLSEAEDASVRLVLEHVAQVGDDLWGQFGPGAVGIGWDQALLGLARHLSGGDPMDPEQSVVWSTSEEGRRFTALSSEQWCLASVAGGTPAAEAQAAAERTTAMYTGAQE